MKRSCKIPFTFVEQNFIKFNRIWWYGWKALSLSFPKLFSDWKSIKYIKEVMSQNVCVCSFPIFHIFNIHSITPLMSTLSIFDIALIFCTVFNAMYLNSSNIKQVALTHIDMHPLMYTQQIRWQWVTMGVNEWLPHYLIRSGSHCYSNFNSKWLVFQEIIQSNF